LHIVDAVGRLDLLDACWDGSMVHVDENIGREEHVEDVVKPLVTEPFGEQFVRLPDHLIFSQLLLARFFIYLGVLPFLLFELDRLAKALVALPLTGLARCIQVMLILFYFNEFILIHCV
jgi:hypothetical protein